MSGDALYLRPARRHTLPLAMVGLIAAGLSSWIVVDSHGHALAITLLVGVVVVAVPFLIQLLFPSWFEWRLDEHGLHVRTWARPVRVAWSDVRVARVVDVAGDPALRLEVEAARGARASRTLHLPVGADVEALHAALARHLGTGTAAESREVADTPADPEAPTDPEAPADPALRR